MKQIWYKSVRVRLIIGLLTVYILSIGLMCFMLLRNVSNKWTEQKIDEITRYGNYIAADIALNELIQGGLSQSLEISGEATMFNQFYSYARVMILDENGKVIDDSCNTKVGTHIINDDTLKALSGRMVKQKRGDYMQIAVPITDYSETTIRGAVYILFAVKDLNGALAPNQSTAISIAIIIAIFVIFFTVWICWKNTDKFNRLLYWLEGLTHSGNLVPERKLQERDEYGAIVEAVQTTMHDMVVLDQSRKEFVSNVSHELKTPLSSMKVLAESLLLQDNVPPEMYREFLQDINSEVDRETGLVNDLLTLVRLEENEKALNITHVSLNDLLEDILKRLKPLAERKEIELVLESGREVEADLDATKITIALSNLIVNAIKYNKENGRVTVRVDSDHLQAQITVEDTGIGIAEENYMKIFQRFYRVDKSRSREDSTGGSGLGLSIVRQIILLHRGTIGVKSVLGEGTTFVVTLPLRQVAEQTEKPDR